MSDASIAAVAAIVVASITSAGAIVVALVSSRRSRGAAASASEDAAAASSDAHDAKTVASVALSTSSDALEAIGTPNGRGNAIELLTEILSGQAGQDRRLARLERNDIDKEQRLRALEPPPRRAK